MKTRESSDRLPRLRILIADDAAIVRLDLRQVLEELGYDVCAEARDGSEAVELAATERPELVVMDIRMPGIDGIEAARRILAERSLPIVMLTAHDSDDLIARAVEAGVYAYLVKPYRPSDLRPAIEAARARHAEHLRAGGATAGDGDAGYYLSGYGYLA